MACLTASGLRWRSILADCHDTIGEKGGTATAKRLSGHSGKGERRRVGDSGLRLDDATTAALRGLRSLLPRRALYVRPSGSNAAAVTLDFDGSPDFRGGGVVCMAGRSSTGRTLRRYPIGSYRRALPSISVLLTVFPHVLKPREQRSARRSESRQKFVGHCAR